MEWQELLDLVARARIDPPPGVLDRPIIFVDSQMQRLRRLSRQGVLDQFPVSTSRHGLGQQQGSYRTPAGIHRIAQKIGAGEPIGRVFRAREASSELCLPGKALVDEDVITTRILWLDGLEEGRNRGGDVDSHDRYIYIHGTSDEGRIGQPASIGCIRMYNHDVIRLFDSVAVDDLVIIA